MFPGGRVDHADHLADPERWCDGVSAAAARMDDVTAGDAIAFRVAAVRELFEEAGILLARDAGGIVPIEEGNERWRVRRHALLEQHVTMQQLAEAEGARLALDALALFGHWVTPPVEKRRFDTYFFLAIAPGAQEAVHDERETTHGVWMRPSDAIDQCLAGEIALPPPTWTTLRWLSRCSSVADAWTWATSQRVPRVQPCVTDGADGTRIIMLPGDPFCPSVEGFAASETRFLLENGRWRPVPAD